MVKHTVGRVVSEVLYYLGHWVHYPMEWFDWAWIYPMYNSLMTASYNVQRWAGNELPWGPYNVEDEE